jgi:LemA protein
VRVYNTKVESVPSNIIAGMFKFGKATYFEVDDQAVRQAPNVSFGEIAYRGDPEPGQLPQQQSNAPVQYGAPNDALPNPQQYDQPPYQQAPSQQPYGQQGGPQSQQYGQQPPGRQGGHSAPDAGPPQSDEAPGGYQPPEAYPPGPTRQ